MPIHSQMGNMLELLVRHELKRKMRELVLSIIYIIIIIIIIIAVLRNSLLSRI